MTDIEVTISISALFNVATNCSIGFSSSHMAETVADEQAALCFAEILNEIIVTNYDVGYG